MGINDDSSWFLQPAKVVLGCKNYECIRDAVTDLLLRCRNHADVGVAADTEPPTPLKVPPYII